MKPLLILILALVLISCTEKKHNTILVKKTDKPILYISNLSKEITTQNDTLYFRNIKFEGVLYELDKNKYDTIAFQSFSNGILNGISKKWYPNAKLMEVRYYNLGQKNGKQIAYFENGQKKFDFTANNDQYEGELLEWNIDGRLIHLATFKNGQEEGTQKMWYDNGKIRANYVMLNGKRYGLLGTKNCRNVSDSIFVVK